MSFCKLDTRFIICIDITPMAIIFLNFHLHYITVVILTSEKTTWEEKGPYIVPAAKYTLVWRKNYTNISSDVRVHAVKFKTVFHDKVNWWTAVFHACEPSKAWTTVVTPACAIQSRLNSSILYLYIYFDEILALRDVMVTYVLRHSWQISWGNAGFQGEDHADVTNITCL